MPVVARGFLRLEMLLSMEALWQREGQENARGGLRSLLAVWLRELSASLGSGLYVAAVPEERARLRQRGALLRYGAARLEGCHAQDCRGVRGGPHADAAEAGGWIAVG